MQNDLEKLVASVGAMAEVTALYRAGLLREGVPEKEAVQYIVAFIAAVMGGGKNGQA